MFRGGPFMGQTTRGHRREHWASTIVLQLADAIEDIQNSKISQQSTSHPKQRFQLFLSQTVQQDKLGASYVIWNMNQKGISRESILDPNFLIQSQFKHSVFHRSLHLFMLKNQGKPLLHLDIHGKADSCGYGAAEVDLGVLSLQEWCGKGDDFHNFAQPIIDQFEQKMNDVFQNLKVQDKKVWFNPDCCLHGRWGPAEKPEFQVHTMVMQGCIWGIPSIQIEIGRTARKILANTPALIKGMAQALLDLYSEVIVPLWSQRKNSFIGTIDEDLASNVVETKHNSAQLKATIKKYIQWDSTASFNLI